MTNAAASLSALSPLDGRYRSKLTATADLFSEYSLIFYRLKIEIEYLFFLSDHKLIPPLTQKSRRLIREISDNFNLKEAQLVKVIEAKTKHDIKAVEYYLSEKLRSISPEHEPYVHLALTSEDVNSLAYAMILMSAKRDLIMPRLQDLLTVLIDLAEKEKATPMLARTHGQPAVPTTFGKEIVVYAMRLLGELKVLATVKIEAKLNGAVGNYNAHALIFPQADWLELSQDFIRQLGLEPQPYTTQILPAESFSRFFDSLARINSILLDLNQNLWRYISDGYLKQANEGSVGSSTMPQKINPIDFENSEGNLGLANSLLSHFSEKLPLSRLQRDLSDSTVKRSIGSAIGYSLLAYDSLGKGLKKISVDRDRLQRDLLDHWEILAEALQVSLRFHGDSAGYEKLKQLSQGKSFTQSDYERLVESLSLPEVVKKQLQDLTPLNYLGLSERIAESGIREAKKYLEENYAPVQRK